MTKNKEIRKSLEPKLRRFYDIGYNHALKDAGEKVMNTTFSEHLQLQKLEVMRLKTKQKRAIEGLVKK